MSTGHESEPSSTNGTHSNDTSLKPPLRHSALAMIQAQLMSDRRKPNQSGSATGDNRIATKAKTLSLRSPQTCMSFDAGAGRCFDGTLDSLVIEAVPGQRTRGKTVLLLNRPDRFSGVR